MDILARYHLPPYKSTSKAKVDGCEFQGSSHRPRAVGFHLRNRKDFIYEDIFDEGADHFAEDYFSIQEGDHVLFWIIEEHDVIRSEEPCAVVVSYSFDTEKSVHLFNTYKEACAFIKQDSYHELLIDTDENGHVEGKDEFYSFEKAEDGYSSATLTVINSTGDKDITEWTISDIKTK